MRVSIVIICLNEERNLPRCLEAINRLDHAGLEVEIVVADGGSKDRTVAIAEAAGARVVSGARGIPQQRNAGGRAARGELIAFVDADVELLPGWFETVQRHFARDTFRVLGGPRRLAADASWIAKAHAMALNPPADEEAKVTHEFRMLSSQSLILGREVFARVGGFREDLRVNEDLAIVLDSERAGATIIADPRLAYIHHGEPATLRQFFKHTIWHTDYPTWLRGIGDERSPIAGGRRYVYGLIVAGELGALGASVLAGPVGWIAGVPATLAAFGLTVGLPALKVALRHGDLSRLGEIGVMYGTYGAALAAALIGAGLNKESHFRR